jgi:hypothetical protein
MPRTSGDGMNNSKRMTMWNKKYSTAQPTTFEENMDCVKQAFIQILKKLISQASAMLQLS